MVAHGSIEGFMGNQKNAMNELLEHSYLLISTDFQQQSYVLILVLAVNFIFFVFSFRLRLSVYRTIQCQYCL